MSKKNLTYNRRCVYCAVSIDHLRSDARHCGSKACVKAKKLDTYSKAVVRHTCKDCNQAFLGTGKQVLCADCKKKTRTSTQKKHIQTVQCTRCGNAMYTREVYNTGNSLSQRSLGICARCKEISEIKARESKTGSRNPNWQGGRWVNRKYRTPEEVRLLMSDKMKLDNPMKRPDVVQKVRETLLSKPRNYKKGISHHLWKGNRKNSFILRTWLGPWIRSILEKDNFSCTRCGRKGTLEVHHSKQSFAELVQLALSMNQESSLGNLDPNSILFQKIGDDLLSLHTLDHGVSLCTACHAEVDTRRRLKKG